MASALCERVSEIPRASIKLERVAIGMMAFSICALAGLAITFFWFAVPASDDYVRATGPAQGGWWHYVITLVYFHWQGRWASCGLEAAVLPRVDLTRHYGLLIGSIVMVDACGAYCVCRWFTEKSPRHTTAGVAACLLALLWAGLPSLAEGVYWFVGAVENTMVISLAASLVVVLIRFSKLQSGGLRSIAAVIACCTAAICICGFHELYGAMLCLALATGSAWALYTPGANRLAWFAVTASAVVGLVVVIAAPGNAHRLVVDGSAHSRQVGYDSRIAISQAIAFVPRWLFNPRLVLASVWVAFCPTLATARRGPVNACAGFPWHYAVPAVWLAMLMIGFFAPSWAFGTRMPARTLSGIYIVFVVGWLTVVHVWSPYLGRIGIQADRFARGVPNIAGLLLSIALLCIGNGPVAIRDLRNRVQPWHADVESRFDQLRQQAGADALVLTLPARSPALLLTGETSAEAQDYRNWGMVSYFKLRSLRLVPAANHAPAPPAHPTAPPQAGSAT